MGAVALMGPPCDVHRTGCTIRASCLAAQLRLHYLRLVQTEMVLFLTLTNHDYH